MRKTFRSPLRSIVTPRSRMVSTSVSATSTSTVSLRHRRERSRENRAHGTGTHHRYAWVSFARHLVGHHTDFGPRSEVDAGDLERAQPEYDLRLGDPAALLGLRLAAKTTIPDSLRRTRDCATSGALEVEATTSASRHSMTARSREYTGSSVDRSGAPRHG